MVVYNFIFKHPYLLCWVWKLTVCEVVWTIGIRW